MATAASFALGTHELVHLIEDEETGLRGVVAIHSTALGPAAGGCRVWTYASQTEMARDALRLSEGMSYKNAMAGLPFGGGKAVLLAPLPNDRRAAFKAFGRAVRQLEGRYVTAEDVGTGVTDMEVVREETHHVAGLGARPGLAGGDPSPWTALGCFLAMQAAVQHQFSTPLAGLRVAVQGLGNVGAELCRLLHEAGAKLVVADPNQERVRAMVERFKAVACDPAEVHAAEADVFAPCALGAVLSESTIAALRARMVCGAANNQLATAEDGRRLADHDILYCPDYVVNAGGIINVSAEYLGETTVEVEERVRMIPNRLLGVIHQARSKTRPTNEVADEQARELIASARRRLVA